MIIDSFRLESSSNLLNDADVIGVWYFDNDATDESNQSNDLTAVNTPTYETSNPSPQQGTHSANCASGSSEYFKDNDSDFDITNGTFTFGGWFYIDTAADGGLGGRHINSGGSYGWSVKTKTNGAVQFGISSDGSTWDSTEETGVYSDETWIHLVFVNDGSNKRLYVNGSEDTDGNFPASYNSGVYNPSGYTRIGGYEYGPVYMNGNVDEIFMFDRALTASEISNIYNNGF